jgi:adenosylhomocysteine nucleosidase
MSLRMVVLTAIEIEYQAARRHLSDLTARRHSAGTIFEIGTLPGSELQVAIAVTGPGNVDAAVLTERAVAAFSPAAVLFVGIAGALHERVALGDVVVGTRVVAYHGGRDDRSGFHPRPRSWEASHVLEQAARHVARADVRSAGDTLPPPTVHFQPIAAGEVVLNSASSPLAQQLRGQYNDAVAVEMESAGVCAAARLNHGLPTLTVRGISDSVHSSKTAAERAGWPLVAAGRAASFAVHLMRQLDTSDFVRRPDGVGADDGGGPASSGIQVNSSTGGVVFAVQAGIQTVYGMPNAR